MVLFPFSFFFCRSLSLFLSTSFLSFRLSFFLDDSLTKVGATLGEYVLHRTRGMVSHPWDHVGIGVQRNRHSSMAQEFLDVLWVYIAAQQQRRAGVTQVVEAYLRKPCSLK